MSDWDSVQYLKFKNERTQPALDLANRVNVEKPTKIIDIGCGPGNSTEILRRRYPDAKILGIDSSENMIAAARKRYSDIEFQLCDAGRELDSIKEKFDIVFSNACIQWIPEHKTLLRNMMSLLKEGGAMAVQIPMNYDEPIHRIILQTAASEKWSGKFSEKRAFYNLSPGGYFDVLSEISSGLSMWQTTYFHIMNSHEDIMEWYRATGMRPYLNALSDSDKAEFESDVKREIIKAYPEQKNGKIIFRFPRLFFIAIR